MIQFNRLNSQAMKQTISFITLGVNDLVKMKEFYMNCFEWKAIKDDEGIVFFKMNSFILALFPSVELADDIGIGLTGSGFKRMSLAINFNSEKEVDEQCRILRDKGVAIIKPPAKVFWGGYHCYIADPENNYWELAYNPFIELDAAGGIL